MFRRTAPAIELASIVHAVFRKVGDVTEAESRGTWWRRLTRGGAVLCSLAPAEALEPSHARISSDLQLAMRAEIMVITEAWAYPFNSAEV